MSRVPRAANAAILWTRVDRPGHESARVRRVGAEWELSGSAVFLHESQPVRLDYRVLCDGEWRTRSAAVSGWVGNAAIDVAIVVNRDGEWLLNGNAAPAVRGCVDVDLNFSPSTNLLPVRRLGLAVGEESSVRAAWLRFPSFTLEPLEQTYRRTAEDVYQYSSGGGRFTAELRVDEHGFPVDYAGVWRGEASA